MKACPAPHRLSVRQRTLRWFNGDVRYRTDAARRLPDPVCKDRTIATESRVPGVSFRKTRDEVALDHGAARTPNL